MPATPEQRREIRTALDKASEARDRGEDARPLYAAAEALMVKYGSAEECPVDADGEPT